MRRRAIGAFTATIVAAALVAGLLPTVVVGDPVLVFPGMEIHQGKHICTLGYVDPALRVAFTAGHCRGDGGPVTDSDDHVIGNITKYRDNTPNGAIVTTEQLIADYESIALTDVTANNILPGGLRLQSDPALVVHPGDAVCHFGVISGESCGTVDNVYNGWFTMGNGIVSDKGDSGGPVYVTRGGGLALIVGMFNSTWGDLPAAVSWSATSQQVRDDGGA